MSDAVFSESLAYNQVKRRAVSARSYRVKTPPTNGTTFTDGQVIQIDLAGNLAGTYYDMSSMYLKVKVAAPQAYQLDRCGALGFIKRLQISTAGAQIADINNWNVLATAMLDTDSSDEWKAGYGNVMLGTQGGQLRGEGVAAAAERVYCIPLVLNPLFNTTPHRLIPGFSLSSIQIRLTLESAADMFLSPVAQGAAVDFTEVELCAMMTELSPMAQAQVDASTGGKYNILATSFMNSGATLDAAATRLTANLGFSMSSLERIIAVHRPSATVGVFNKYSLGNRTTAGLAQYQYLINAESYPARPVIVDAKGAESTAEMLIADHSLVDFKKGSTFNNGVVGSTIISGPCVGASGGVQPQTDKSACFTLATAAALGTTAGDNVAAGNDSDVGTYLNATDFENGLSVGKSATIYSGISTIASNVQWLGNYVGANVGGVSVDFFACYSVLISLDMRGSGVFSVSV
jgi:hypothetical protein